MPTSLRGLNTPATDDGALKAARPAIEATLQIKRLGGWLKAEPADPQPGIAGSVFVFVESCDLAPGVL